MRRRKQPTVRLSAPDDRVFSITDIAGTLGFIPKGSPVSRSHPHVVNAPELFEVRYRLDLERSEVTTDAEAAE
jgi:hypothetical protein